MKFRILAIGKVGKGPLSDLMAEYSKRLGPETEIRELVSRKMPTPDLQKESDAALIRTHIAGGARLMLLDERGHNFSSRDFAQQIARWEGQGNSSVCVVIGGPDGLSGCLRESADLIVSFGRMTWPHMMARVMLMEQIYRARQILAGHPYHRD